MSTQTQHNKSEIKKVTTASFIGALLEWYDFFIFGTAAAVVFAPLFYPGTDPTTGTIAAFATFGVGFVARPLGAIVFGHFGDRVGRKSVLVITLMIMGIGTFLIGCLPTYETAGIWAPIMLVVLRLAQGFGLGGEYAGAALMTIEHAPEGRKGFFGSIIQSAASGGILLATGVFALVSSFGEDFLLSWGWRLPFLVSIGLLIVGLFIRLSISESPEFAKARELQAAKQEQPKIPLFVIFRKYPKNLALAFGARLGETVSSNVVNAFGIYYVSTHIGLNSQVGLYGMLIASAIGLVAVPCIGALSDKVGRKKVYLFGAFAGVVLAFPLFLLFNTGQVWAVFLAFSLVYVLVPTTMFAVQSVFFSELFGTDVRYTGLSLATQVSAIVGGYVPTAATALLLVLGGDPWLVAGGFMLTCLVTAVCVFLASDVRKDDPALNTTTDAPAKASV